MASLQAEMSHCLESTTRILKKLSGSFLVIWRKAGLATGDIRSETRRLHQSDFPFFHLPLVKYIELLGEWSTDLPVLREYIGQCLANAGKYAVCLPGSQGIDECCKSKNTGQFKPHNVTLSNSSKDGNTFQPSRGCSAV